MTNLFGKDMNFEDLSELEIKHKLHNFSIRYQNQLKEEYKNSTDTASQYYTSAFAFRKGKSSPDKGTIFYMVFGSSSLSVLQNTKTNMQSVTQKGTQLAFTDFYPYNDIEIAEGRKTTDEEEADTIYNKFKGSKIKLGEVKRFVLEETPYPFHARALKVLEKDKRLNVGDLDASGQPVKRRKGKFCFKVGPTEFEDDTTDKEYGNHWCLTFK